ncbi:MAG: hypothetical protein Q8930_19020, partial [Bacillota bacterium]|nr:hypothetical protein [Bacillota bacterium]
MEQNKSMDAGRSGIVIGRGRLAAVIALVMSILILFSCLEGIFNKSIYNDLLSAGTITKYLLSGSRAQDIIFIPLTLVLGFLCILFLKRPGYKILITIIGLCGNFFYGYGLYAMQGQYTKI